MNKNYQDNLIRELSLVRQFHMLTSLDKAGPGSAIFPTEKIVAGNNFLESPWRSRSNRHFSQELPATSQIQDIIAKSYGLWCGRRNVSSAGSLYGLEILALSDEICIAFDPPSFSHFLPNPSSSLNQILYHQFSGRYWLISLFGAVERYIARYGVRGYRYLILEAGMALHEIEVLLESRGLSYCIAGGLDEQSLVDCLGLSLTGLLPLISCVAGVP